MIALILAGGFGTRLQHVITDVPKPMAPVKNRPFLSYVIDHLIKNRINKIILATGYKHEVIESYFGKNYDSVELQYSVETEPLGTGGAIKKALNAVDDDHFCVINGDTLFKADISSMHKLHSETDADITISLKPMKNFDRYGAVDVNGYNVVGFHEKRHRDEGLINCGSYIIRKDIFSRFELPASFSFEKEMLEKHCSSLNIVAYISDEYFIDIGIPEDYLKAQKEL